ncbi:MAG: hypothetical protein GEV09_08610 [Pseudonocardiaceae bacterium]|nr:hypothetical protein [Pseudonocardiaceae bacterium]
MKPSFCYDGCGARATGLSAYCDECAEAHNRAADNRVDRSYSQAHPFRVGGRVRIERDEQLYPSKGSWPRYRGRTGTVVELNPTPTRTAPPEIGVSFNATPRTDAWFQPHELAQMGALAAESDSDGLLAQCHVA